MACAFQRRWHQETPRNAEADNINKWHWMETFGGIHRRLQAHALPGGTGPNNLILHFSRYSKQIAEQHELHALTDFRPNHSAQHSSLTEYHTPILPRPSAAAWPAAPPLSGVRRHRLVSLWPSPHPV